MGLKEIRLLGVDWIDLAQDKEVASPRINAVIEPSGSIKCGVFLDSLKVC
jgi:hypothetical protein